MNSQVMFLGVVLIAAMVSGAPSEPEGINAPNAQLLSDVVIHEGAPDGKQFVTPFNFKSVMLSNSVGGKACWRCSEPCPNTTCCDDGYPQCCQLFGLCGCCGRALA